MSSCKHMIWVDDFDNKNMTPGAMPSGEEWDLEEDIDCSEENHKKDVEDNFGDYADQVQLITSMSGMVDYIESDLKKCDCIVLDVNLKKSLSEKQRKTVSESCKRKGIKIDRQIGEHGGYYLYLYLLKSGFPADHICMFTGNKGEGNSTGFWERRFEEAGMYPPKSINRNEPEELRDWIRQIYSQEYYRIRLLVYQACEYWKGELGRLSPDDIAFNQIYYTEKGGFRVEAGSFMDMLDRVEMLFPLMEPSNSGRLYYQALQTATMFHEESAKLDVLKKAKYSDLRKYHWSIRNFRNWSAHNQFSRDEMDGRLFAYLFCITLRTYFVESGRQFSADPGDKGGIFNVYEKEYFEHEKESAFVFSAFQNKYQNAFNRHLTRVKDHGDKENNCWDYKDIHSLLRASGRCRTSAGIKMLFPDILLNITDDWIVQENQKESSDYKPEKGSMGYELQYTYSCSYRWKNDTFDWDTVKKNDFFRACAYLLLSIL